ncbi:hypothetical protein CAPTEDRAFT_216817 [Capitella teleta]|uniref:Disintegrin domain-containing protein n=1 Tax=Capitella teleta TaxID=283909 RepID=R7USG1_CAPTE|nr:hypothetical protein CAPTEDRAFT_216817 [Capitella teleta]|eukprot:ELU09130.1 hypothetical protein CAPTEDRAFT_216817 [Capitella teleta]
MSRTGGGLHKRLKHYETLHRNDLSRHTIVKRSADLNSVFAQQKIISLKAFGRNFDLHLQKQRGLLSSSFKAITVFGNSSIEDIYIDAEDFFEGYVQDDPRASKVRAHFEGDDLVATIWMLGEVYSIEPSWRHLPESADYSMIAYRASDLIRDRQDNPEGHAGSNFCGFVHADMDEASAERHPPPDDPTSSKKTPGKRNKRQVDSHNTCPVMLVADYHFFNKVGGQSVAASASYLLGVISRVDSIYRATNFGSGYSGIGLEIQGTFGKNSKWADYCLVHLFTFLAFSNGVLGLGWIASSASNQAGGICSPSSGGTHYNTAWTSHANKYGTRLLTQESDLVTAHGHNWGSPHDPFSNECTPDSNGGGKFLMYTYSVSGTESNNELFSPCSKRSVLAVLQAKAANCFSEKSNSYCGNFLVEESEECDAGSRGREGIDPCCDAQCRFKGDAVCSDSNSLCCQNCKAAPATFVCSEASNSSTSCTGDAHCDGSSFDCPNPANKDDGTSCVDRGSCTAGVCVALCESKNLTSCICDAVEDSCKFCCRKGNGPCEVYGASTGQTAIDLANGKSCLQGSCKEGVCETEIRSVTDRLWSVISDLSVDLILEIMRDNIVIATVLISLVLYIPLCLIVYCIDRKRNKLEKETVEWHNRDNENLISDKDSRVIRPTHRRKRPV